MVFRAMRWLRSRWGRVGPRIEVCDAGVQMNMERASADSQETRRKTWWFLKVWEVNYVSAAKSPEPQGSR